MWTWCHFDRSELIAQLNSRRGQAAKDITILIFHPEDVPVPTPSDFQGYVYRRVSERHRVEFLLTDVVESLRVQGFVAGDITKSARNWHGVVRVPQRDEGGLWESRRARSNGIKTQTGEFLYVEIVYVHPSILSCYSHKLALQHGAYAVERSSDAHQYW